MHIQGPQHEKPASRRSNTTKHRQPSSHSYCTGIRTASMAVVLTAAAPRTVGTMIRFVLGLLLPFALLGGSANAAETLAYYSDYFSFVGEDAQGRVAFALDNNRGQ